LTKSDAPSLSQSCGEATMTCSHSGRVDGVVVWFDLALLWGKDGCSSHLDGENMMDVAHDDGGVILPGGLAREGSAWDAVFFFLPSGLCVEEGDVIALSTSTSEDRLVFSIRAASSSKQSMMSDSPVTRQMVFITQPPDEHAWRQRCSESGVIAHPRPPPCDSPVTCYADGGHFALSQKEVAALQPSSVEAAASAFLNAAAAVTARSSTHQGNGDSVELLEQVGGFSLVGLVALRKLKATGQPLLR